MNFEGGIQTSGRDENFEMKGGMTETHEKLMVCDAA
jgi:hypothetical protein